MEPIRHPHNTPATHQFVIVGLGAIGTLFAAHVGRTHDCWALEPADRPRPAGSGNAGLLGRHLVSHGSAISFDIPSLESLASLTFPADRPCHLWLLLTCKAPVANRLLPGLLDELRRLALEHATCRANLVIMQNGLQTHTLAMNLFAKTFAGADRSRVRLLAASTTEAARREAADPNTVHHSAVGQTTVGQLDDLLEPLTAAPTSCLSDLLERSGLCASSVDDIGSILWNKLALNAIVNPLTALLGCTNGELPTLPAYRRLAPPVAGEVLAAWQHWRGQGDRTSTLVIPDTVDALLTRVEDICQRTAVNKSSMLQDVLAGRTTEIQAINGHIIDYCERFGLESKANRELVSAIEGLTPE